jgi:hypothetical protein
MFVGCARTMEYPQSWRQAMLPLPFGVPISGVLAFSCASSCFTPWPMAPDQPHPLQDVVLAPRLILLVQIACAANCVPPGTPTASHCQECGTPMARTPDRCPVTSSPPRSSLWGPATIPPNRYHRRGAPESVQQRRAKPDAGDGTRTAAATQGSVGRPAWDPRLLVSWWVYEMARAL